MRTSLAIRRAGLSLLFISWLFLQPSFLPAQSARDQDRRDIYFEKYHCEEAFRQAQGAEERGQWPVALDRYVSMMEKYPNEVYKKPDSENTYISAYEYVLQRLSRFPPEGMSLYQERFGGKAAYEFEQARRAKDFKKYDQIVFRYFFTPSAEQALLDLANHCFDEGRIDRAVFYWNRYLNYFQKPSVAPPVIVARLAHAYGLLQNREGLDELRLLASSRGWLREEVTVEDQRLPLEQLLDRVQKAASRSQPPETAADTVYSSEIRWWERDLQDFVQVRIRTNDFQGGQYEIMADMVPAYVRFQDREYILVQNGYTIVALDPAHRGKEFWHYPESDQDAKSITAPGPYYIQFSTRYGCASYQNLIIANMFSQREVGARGNRQKISVNTLKAFRIDTGQTVWDTEQKVLPELEGLMLASPPLVKDDRVYVAAVNEPPVGGVQMERESYLLCFDARSGRLLWKVFICSSNTGGNYYYGISLESPQISEAHGMIYYQTNNGVVASLESSTGSILWATQYESMAITVPTPRTPRSLASTPPLVHRGILYSFPADSTQVLGFNKNTGEARAALKVGRGKQGQVQRGYLLGIQDNVLFVVTQQMPYFKDLSETGSEMKEVTHKANWIGLGAIHGDHVYLPESNGLRVFSIHQQMKLTPMSSPWSSPDTAGNILLADRYLFTVGKKLTAYVSYHTIQQDYQLRLNHDPVDPQLLLEYGSLLFENGMMAGGDRGEFGKKMLTDSTVHLQRYLKLAHDTLSEEQRSGIETRLYSAYFALSERAEPEDVLDFLKLAGRYAVSDSQKVSVVYRLAHVLSDQKKYPEAIEQYYEIINRYPDVMLPDEKKTQPEVTFSMRAVQEIQQLLQEHGPAVYEAIERLASAELDRLDKGDLAGHRALAVKYPHSQAAVKAMETLFEYYRRRAEWKEAAAVLERMRRDLPPMKREPSVVVRLVQASEKLGDLDRVEALLSEMKDSFGGLQIEGLETGAWVEKKLKEVQALRETVPALQVPLKRLASWNEPYGVPNRPDQIFTGLVPLIPATPYPTSFNPDWELFRNGSTVELWDVRQKKRIWSRPCPGVFVGVTYEQAEGLVVNEVAEDSPAKRAGLSPGDKISMIDDRPATADALSAVLSGPFSAQKIKLEVLSGGKKKVLILEATERPAAFKPEVTGLMIARDYSVLVIWDDAIVSLDWTDGSVRWIYRDAVRSAKILTCALQRDGLVLIEGKPFSSRRSTNQKTLPAEMRLVRLDDISGKVQWRKTLEYYDQFSQVIFPGGAPALYTSARSNNLILGYVVAQTQGAMGEDEVWRSQQPQQVTGYSLKFVRLDGETGLEENRGGAQYMARTDVPIRVAWEASSEHLYVVSYSTQGQRVLDCLALREDMKAWTTPLDQKFVSGVSVSLAASPGAVGVAHPAGGIALYRSSDGTRMPAELPAGRAVAGQGNAVRGGSVCAWVNDTILLVYVVPRSGGSTIAYLTAIDVSGEKSKVLWEEPAPRMERDDIVLDTRLKNFILMYIASGNQPGVTGARPIAVIYAQEAGTVPKGGYRIAKSSDQVFVGGPPVPVWASRLHIYLLTAKGLEVYGN